MKRTIMAALAALLCTTGCALQPAYQRPIAPIAAAYPGNAAAPADALTRSAADIGWREFLRDERLRKLVELALANNRDLRAAAANVELVRAQYQIQRAALLPQLQAGVSAGVARGTSARNGFAPAATLSGTWELDFFGRLRNLRDAALERYAASQEAWRAARILLVAQVADQYLTMQAYDQELAVTDAVLASARASLRIVQLEYDNGASSALALSQAQGAVDVALASQAAQRRLRAQAENGLVLLVGQPLPPLAARPDEADTRQVLTDIPAGLPSDLLTRRPDILQAEAELRAAHADIGAARAAYFPAISLTAALGVASGSLGGLLAGARSSLNAVPALSMPLFDGGAARAGLDAARAQRDIDVARYQKAIQTAFREVADGLAARATYVDQLAAQQRNAAEQARRLTLASLLYNNGATGYLDVLTAQTDAYNARLAVVTARLGQQTALVDLYRALGGGWHADYASAAAVRAHD